MAAELSSSHKERYTQCIPPRMFFNSGGGGSVRWMLMQRRRRRGGGEVEERWRKRVEEEGGSGSQNCFRTAGTPSLSPCLRPPEMHRPAMPRRTPARYSCCRRVGECCSGGYYEGSLKAHRCRVARSRGC